MYLRKAFWQRYFSNTVWFHNFKFSIFYCFLLTSCAWHTHLLGCLLSLRLCYPSPFSLISSIISLRFSSVTSRLCFQMHLFMRSVRQAIPRTSWQYVRRNKQFLVYPWLPNVVNCRTKIWDVSFRRGRGFIKPDGESCHFFATLSSIVWSLCQSNVACR